MQAATSSQSSVAKTCQALALSPPAMRAAELELGFESLVVNQGRNSDRNRTTAAPMPMYSPGVSRDEIEVAALPLRPRGFHRGTCSATGR